MPSFELVSVGCRSDFVPSKAVGFDVVFERELESHRGLFQHAYNQMTGAIAHLGNLGMSEEDYGFWANKLFALDHEDVSIAATRTENSWFPYSTESLRLRIAATVRAELSALLVQLMEASDAGIVTVATDYQFGGPADVRAFDSLEQFWDEHDSRRLFFNTISIVGAPSEKRDEIKGLSVEACKMDAGRIAAQQADQD